MKTRKTKPRRKARKAVHAKASKRVDVASRAGQGEMEPDEWALPIDDGYTIHRLWFVG
ncbi:MAG: hypothetical protein HYR96_03055 [Deltaproteobacteria bacterium]|nr:hypothetical protein [Deltaproteobacteria bacterium]MBI3294078.1 hypothetical protein [Deltaproteobacteria bacterium]